MKRVGQAKTPPTLLLPFNLTANLSVGITFAMRVDIQFSPKQFSALFAAQYDGAADGRIGSWKRYRHGGILADICRSINSNLRCRQSAIRNKIVESSRVAVVSESSFAKGVAVIGRNGGTSRQVRHQQIGFRIRAANGRDKVSPSNHQDQLSLLGYPDRKISQRYIFAHQRKATATCALFPRSEFAFHAITLRERDELKIGFCRCRFSRLTRVRPCFSA